MTMGAWELHSFREFDFTNSLLKVRHRLCERKGSVLAVRGEVETTLRLYAPHELWRLVKASGWQPLSLHASLALEPLGPRLSHHRPAGSKNFMMSCPPQSWRGS